MDKTTLVKDDVSEGRKLIEYLDKTDFKVNSALWFYIPDSNKWKLILASDYPKKRSLKDAYNFIQEALKKADTKDIALDNISIIKDDDDLIKLLRLALPVGHNMHEIRFTRNVVNGIMIEDALVYRIN